MATECPECRGSLRPGALFGDTIALHCRSCGRAFSQLLARWFADVLRAERAAA